MGRFRLSSFASRGRGEVLVIIGVVAALLAIMLPIVRRTYQTSLTVRCRQQLGELFTAVQHYALNNSGYPPCHGDGSGDWRERIDPLLEPDRPRGAAGRSRLWECPAGGSYVGNERVFGPPYRPLRTYMLRLEIGAIADGSERAAGAGVGDFGSLDWRHRGGANVVFLDGHVEWFPEDKAGRVRRHWDEPQ